MGNYTPFEKLVLVCAMVLFGAGSFALFKVGHVVREPAFESSVFSTSKKPASFALQNAYLELSPRTTLTASVKLGRLTFSQMMGRFVFNILPGVKIRFESGRQSFDLASVNGGRIEVEARNGGLQVQNVAGDVLVFGAGNGHIRLAKSAYATVTNGRLEVANLPMPEILSPRINQRYFTSRSDGEVLVDFKRGKFVTTQVEYVVSDHARILTFRGVTNAGILKLNLAPGQYHLSARAVFGHSYSAWTEPRSFSVWSRPTDLATAF